MRRCRREAGLRPGGELGTQLCLGLVPPRMPTKAVGEGPLPQHTQDHFSYIFMRKLRQRKHTPRTGGRGPYHLSLSRNTRLFLLRSPFIVHLCLAPLSPHPVPSGKSPPPHRVCPPHSSHQRVPVSMSQAPASAHSPPGSHLPADKSPSHLRGPQGPVRPVLSPPRLPPSLSPPHSSAPQGPPCCSLPGGQVQSCPRAFAQAVLPT